MKYENMKYIFFINLLALANSAVILSDQFSWEWKSSNVSQIKLKIKFDPLNIFSNDELHIILTGRNLEISIRVFNFIFLTIVEILNKPWSSEI